MRLWTVHPKYLDPKGLVALWREALLAKSVLTKGGGGYYNHPQLIRFKTAVNPIAAIHFYLEGIWRESRERGYRFDRRKFESVREVEPIEVPKGQAIWEIVHLAGKLSERAPSFLDRFVGPQPDLHCLFYMDEKNEERAFWERG